MWWTGANSITMNSIWNVIQDCILKKDTDNVLQTDTERNMVRRSVMESSLMK